MCGLCALFSFSQTLNVVRHGKLDSNSFVFFAYKMTDIYFVCTAPKFCAQRDNTRSLKTSSLPFAEYVFFRSSSSSSSTISLTRNEDDWHNAFYAIPNILFLAYLFCLNCVMWWQSRKARAWNTIVKHECLTLCCQSNTRNNNNNYEEEEKTYPVSLGAFEGLTLE